MSYDELLRSRRIRKERISAKEVRQALQRAERDLGAARAMMAEDWDWAFAIAYDAVFQASRAYMFAQGCRPASAESHKNAFAFMRLLFAKAEEFVRLVHEQLGMESGSQTTARPKPGRRARKR